MPGSGSPSNPNQRQSPEKGSSMVVTGGNRTGWDVKCLQNLDFGFECCSGIAMMRIVYGHGVAITCSCRHRIPSPKNMYG